MPKISIQVCCYNSEKYLEDTLESIVAQTYKDWELVVVNDGSCDSTEDIVKRFVKRGIPIVYHFQKNRGFAAARNKAIELSSGEWIAILDHDDLWYPEKLQIQSRSIERYPNAALHFSNSEWFTDDNTVIKNTVEPGRFKTGITEDAFVKLVGQGCFIDSETVIIRKSALRECGSFNEGYRYIVDYDLFIRLTHKYSEVYYEDMVLAKWRVHLSQASQSMKGVMFKEYAGLFESLLTQYNLTFAVKRHCRHIIACNQMKHALYSLQRRAIKDCMKSALRVNIFWLIDLVCVKCVNKIKRIWD